MAFSAQAIRDHVIATLGMERARELAGPDAFSPTAPEWKVKDTFGELLLDDAARAVLLDYDIAPKGLAPFSDSRPEYMTTIAFRQAWFVDAMVRKYMPDATRFFDFGCGTGRLLRMLAQFAPERTYSGADVNPIAIDWLQKRNIKNAGEIAKIATEPPLPFSDSSFDVVLAWSIFSHYSEPLHRRWLDELTRVVVPGGLLLLTIHQGLTPLPEVRGELSEETKQDIIRGYESTGYGYAPYYTETPHSIRHGIDSDEFGLAYISPDYVHSHWPSAGLKVLEITEAAKRWQDMVVLRKE